MNGIIFFKTNKLDTLKEFYVNEVGCDIWLKQADCIIFKFGNMLFGFCDREVVDTGGMITFFYETQSEVDVMYEKLSSIAEALPSMNPKYDIYHFFAKDPEGRAIEFQWFKNENKPF